MRRRAVPEPGSLLFITGYMIFLEGIVPDLEIKISRLAFQLKRHFGGLDKDWGPMLEDVRQRGLQLRAQKEAELGRAKGFSGIAKLIGYSFLLSGLIIDIYIATSEFDILSYWTRSED